MRQAIGVVALVCVVAACGVVRDARADAARGSALAQQWCSQCHGVRPNQPSPIAKAPGFAEIAAEPSATEMSLRVFLQTPHPNMPNLMLQRDDLDDLVGYIISMKPAR